MKRLLVAFEAGIVTALAIVALHRLSRMTGWKPKASRSAFTRLCARAPTNADLKALFRLTCWVTMSSKNYIADVLEESNTWVVHWPLK